MARFSRILTGFESSPTTTTTANPPEYVNVESDFVVILAALLCALICTIGLIAVARCAWLRRRATSSSTTSSSSHSAAANKGLKKKVLHSLPKFTYGASKATVGGDFCDFASAECAICLGEFCDGEIVRVLPQCGHGFHIGCIDTWLGSHSTCPSCRQILVVAICRKCGVSDDCKSRVHNVSDNNINININNASCISTNNQSSSVISGEFLP
ncbi:RING-H2 finger protein ATL8-like [Euphorbia lathyris]|uniref:RING-H2 finger protein ATL8-like n=1 Tax=Euphorbia lathyris TaxID=212925 RepID=UPI003313833F